MMKLLVSAMILFVSDAAAAKAASITPESYTYDQATRCGTWCYLDPNNTKLTDGVIGDAGFGVNNAQAWDGWIIPVGGYLNIDFTFSDTVHIDSISIGSTQDRVNDVVLPNFSVSELVGGQWQQVATLINPLSASNNASVFSTASHPFFTLSNLNLDTNQVRVTAQANGVNPSSFVFIDEVSFNSAAAPAPAPVPAPSPFALLGAGLLGLVAMRLHRTSAA